MRDENLTMTFRDQDNESILSDGQHRIYKKVFRKMRAKVKMVCGSQRTTSGGNDKPKWQPILN